MFYVTSVATTNIYRIYMKGNKGLSVGSVVKNSLAMQETQVSFLGQEEPLAKEMATHSSILAWEIPLTEETCELTIHVVTRVGQDLVTKPPPPPQRSKK